MSNRRVVAWLSAALCLITSLSYIADVQAQTSSSPNYRLEEGVLGTGGLIDSSSSNFSVRETIGDGAGGDSSSTNFNFSAGGTTTSDPTLTFAITDASAGFPPFSPNIPSTATAEFTVLNYTSWGYAVHMIGSPPEDNGHVIDAMASTGPSVPGTEQFGFNLVANTDPANFGANPAHGLFAFGDATDDYDDPNSYRFVSGEAIAQAPKSSGTATYTISYIVNVNSLTPGGKYYGIQQLVVTGTY